MSVLQIRGMSDTNQMDRLATVSQTDGNMIHTFNGNSDGFFLALHLDAIATFANCFLIAALIRCPLRNSKGHLIKEVFI